MSQSHLSTSQVATEAGGPHIPGPRLNVIPFPRRLAAPEPREDFAALTVTIAAIAALGKPATLAEIVDAVTHCSSLPLAGDRIEGALLAWSAPPGRATGLGLFQAVRLGGGDAWAFSSNLRRVLGAQGVSLRLRDLDDAPGVQP